MVLVFNCNVIVPSIFTKRLKIIMQENMTAGIDVVLDGLSCLWMPLCTCAQQCACAGLW
jgi:hypothetical protein